MRWHQIEGNWKPFDGCEARGELTTDENKQSADKCEIHLGKLQEGFWIAQDKAEMRVNGFGNAIRGSLYIF